MKHVPLEYDIAALEDQKRYTELKELFVSLEKIIYQWKNYSMYSRKQNDAIRSEYKLQEQWGMLQSRL